MPQDSSSIPREEFNGELVYGTVGPRTDIHGFCKIKLRKYDIFGRFSRYEEITVHESLLHLYKDYAYA